MTNKSQSRPQNQCRTVHGGEGALVRIRKGEPFIGLALKALESVFAEMGVDLDALSGLEAILVKRAARFEATARMFDAAADSAAAEGDLDRWERYEQRAGWIGSKGFQAFLGVRKLLAASSDAVILDAIREAKGDDPGVA